MVRFYKCSSPDVAVRLKPSYSTLYDSVMKSILRFGFWLKLQDVCTIQLAETFDQN